MPQKVAVLGTGKIGEALLSGMIRAGWAPTDLLVTARRPERARELQERHGVTPVSNAEAAKTADTLILTVKPQDMGALLDELAPHIPADRLIISGAAGIPTSFFEERLAPGTPVVRVMTNTPALVDEAMSVISAGSHATAEHVAYAEEIFGAVPSARPRVALGAEGTAGTGAGVSCCRRRVRGCGRGPLPGPR